MNIASWGYRIFPKGKSHIVRKIFPTAREILVKQSLKSLPLSQFRNVLVAGAGLDPYQSYFPNAQSYVCFDIDGDHENIDVRADALSMPFRNGSCDCVLATEILEHLNEPALFIQEVYRVLSPGGLIIVTVPFMFHQHANPYDFNRPTREALLRWFGKYKNVKVSSQGNRLHVISDLLSTSFSGNKYLQAPFVMLRVFNHLFSVIGRLMNCDSSTAPTGYLLVAEKRKEE